MVCGAGISSSITEWFTFIISDKKGMQGFLEKIQRKVKESIYIVLFRILKDMQLSIIWKLACVYKL